MTTKTAGNESANAEILGVVILIGIFAITAGIISATTLASPQPVKVPAASLEITGTADGIRIAHLGGDSLPLDNRLMVRGVTSGDAIVTKGGSDLGFTGSSLANGFNNVIEDTEGWKAAVISWKGEAGESVIASWNPDGLQLPDPSTPSGGSVPGGVQTVVPTQPTWTTASTDWGAESQKITANFNANPTTVGTGPAQVIQFSDTSTGNVAIDAWSWNFGDGGTSTEQNPKHYYSATGSYTVTLTASNVATGASNTIVKPGCVQVEGIGSPSPVNFDLSATEGNTVLTVVCTDTSTSSPTLWRWTTSDALNPANSAVRGPIADGGPQTFTFNNPSGSVNNICNITLEIWSPYFESPISVTKSVTVGPPLGAAEFGTNLTGPVGVAPVSNGIPALPVQFQDLSPGVPQSWSWNFGDGTTSTERNPVHTFTVGPNEVRTFTVTLTVKGWGQESTPVTHTIRVVPAISVQFKADVTEGSAPLTVRFTDHTTGFPTKWLWTFSKEAKIGEAMTSTTSTEQNPVHTFTEEGKYDVTLFAENATDPLIHSAGSQTIEVFIRVGDEVTAAFDATPILGDAPLTVQFTDHSTNANADGLFWTFGDGNSAIGSTPTHTYAAPGNYRVTLRAESDYRFDEATADISVLGPIEASFTGSPISVKVGDPVQFKNTSSGNPYTFAWTFGDGTTSTEPNPSHIYAAAGTYTVSLTATNPHFSGSAMKSITVYDQVDALFDADVKRGRAPLTVKFRDLSTGTGINYRKWDFGDGTTLTLTAKEDPTHTYLRAGKYSVSLNVSNGPTSDEYTEVNYVITVLDTLIASFKASPTAGPAPLTVQFTNTSAGTPESWEWDFNNDGVIDSRDENPVYTFPNVETYNVVLTVHHDDTSRFGPVPITVYAPITAQFAVTPTSGNVPLTVQFTDRSAGGLDSWSWDFDNDGKIDSTDQNPSFTYATPGTYEARLTVWNHLRTDLKTTTSKAIIAGPPLASFNAKPLTGFSPLTVQFTDTSINSPTSWTWDFGDGSTSDLQNPTHTFTKKNPSGSAYVVTLHTSNVVGGCAAPASRTITVM